MQALSVLLYRAWWFVS